MVYIGKSLRYARKSRNLTQNELAKGIVSRTTISKIETGDQDPSFYTVQRLLDRVGITVDESFRFDNESYEFLYFDILHRFKSLYFSTQSAHIDLLISDIRFLEQQRHSDILTNIQSLLIAFKQIDNLTVFELKKIVEPVWNKLSKVNKWTELDLYMINHLLFFFEDEMVEHMLLQAISNINNYYPDLISLKNSFTTNISFLYIKTKQLDKAMQYAKESVKLSKQLKRYDLVLLNKIRMCTLRQEKNKQKYYLSLLELMEDKHLFQGVKNEIKEIEQTVFSD